MYKRHVHLDEPKHPGQKLWRYLKYERLIQLLEDGYLYFPHLSQMRDKLEGMLTDRTKNKFFFSEYSKCRDYKTAKYSVEEYEKSSNEFFLNCWHVNHNESYLMWKVYGERGCAIQTTFENLKSAFHVSSAEITGCLVKYIDFERAEIPIGNSFYSVSYKDIPYEDEREFRLLYWKLANPNLSLSISDKGVKIKVDNSLLIDNIYINPVADIDLSKLEALIITERLSCNIITTKIQE